ncbi:MAG TPA: adenylate cyclase regulatory domain-containing protein [Candidatus Limnocylindria bacterium]|nr:adenylate cyclase regulatory domain-containing protein [Candidatus Limnocylindria bacterium]
MSPTTDPGADDLRLAIAAIVLGAEPEYDQPAFEAASGIPLERAERYWRALGFPDADPGEAPYTATDIEALKHAVDLVDNGGIEEKYVLAVTRALGQTMSRLADWEVDIAVDRLLAEGRPMDPVRTRARLESSLPDLEHMLVHAWRRHLLAAVERVLDADQDDLSAVSLTVGFADVVGFTGLTRRLDEDELGALVEGFEAWAAGAVIALGGRLVKTMGDEVLFAAIEPEVGIEAALHLAAGWGRDQPPVRVGLATGRVVHRMGDVFGTPVNLASRLTAFARPGSALSDATTAAAVGSMHGVGARALSPRSVRGLGIVEPWLLTATPHIESPKTYQ